eukprot:TRINITY_DN11862_c0_g1_i1.p1 TRINITY_DN11862_c0_g1~~TRINITY_DN11862_c0_g1_i1.p1  ORF type:complete len:143 (+),score=13.90 TRINITY_DN11862_c0_g1_i1:116-544(+)
MKAGVVAPNSCLVTSLRSCTPGHESQSRGRIVLRQSTLHETINSENNAHIKQDNNPYATPVNARNSFLYNTVYTFSNSNISYQVQRENRRLEHHIRIKKNLERLTENELKKIERVFSESRRRDKEREYNRQKALEEKVQLHA